jgi:hypothetical protein
LEDFRDDKRSRETHEAKTDPDPLLFRKSKGTTAKLSYMGGLLLENRHALVIAQVTQAMGTAERGAPSTWSKRSPARTRSRYSTPQIEREVPEQCARARLAAL